MVTSYVSAELIKCDLGNEYFFEDDGDDDQEFDEGECFLFN